MVLDGFSSTLVFFVNGQKVVEPNVEPNLSLVSYLRTTLGLCGTKVGCGEGGCGSCTVMLSKYELTAKKIKHWAVTACLVPVASLHGCAVTTVEGIGGNGTRGHRKLHALQERLAASHGTQCGFCTPGFVMSMYALLRNHPRPTRRQIQSAIQGNLCRCTGYRPIVDAFNSFAVCGQSNSEKCPCKSEGSCGVISEPDETEATASQEAIFPPELMTNPDYVREALYFRGVLSSWYRPLDMKVLLELMETFPNCNLIAGNTELGTKQKDGPAHVDQMTYIDVTAIEELKHTEVTGAGIRIGGAVTLSDIQELCLFHLEDQICPWKTQTLDQLLKILEWFGNKSIRNAATIGGNIAASSPVSDLIPFLVAVEAQVTLVSKAGRRSFRLDDEFFLGYRRNKIHEEHAVIQDILIPFTDKDEYLVCYKQSRRQEDDIAVINAAFSVKVDRSSRKVQECIVAFGGAGATVIVAKRTMHFLLNRVWNGEIVNDVVELLARDCFLEKNAPGGLIQYRQALVFSLFFKFFQTVESKLAGALEPQPPRYEQESQQKYHMGLENAPVGEPYQHHSALQHCSGEAVYTDDIPSVQGELYLGLVLSSEPHALIKKIDFSAALATEGVEATFCAKDFPPEFNKTGHVVQDEFIFADEKVEYVGQIVAAVVGRTREVAARAAKLVSVEYEGLPYVLTIEEAIEQESFYTLQKLETGDVEKAKLESDVIIEGELRIGGQEHFYLEPQACLVRPKLEHDEIEIFSATQDAKAMQHQVAACLGIPENRVIVRVKRLGGGFGGKESRSAAILLPAAMIAKRMNRPVRCVLDRNEDMQLTGGRHPFLVKYRVGASRIGRITFLEQHLYSNGGASLDFSASVTRVAVLHSQNAYRIPNARICGYPCRTNLAPNTAFRCFGRPQAMLAAETWMNHLASQLLMDVNELRELNMLDENDQMCFGQLLTNCNLRRCWKLLLEQSDYLRSKEEIREFNRQNRWKKRGIAAVPTVFGVGFGRDYMNQASALVLVYTDGSVLLQHGGVEMGQGLHTKMIQIASKELGIDMSLIHVTETATDRIPNASPTAASSSSDLNGAALIDACRKLSQRLLPYRLRNPSGTWKDWVQTAYKDRVSLIATGFYSVTKGLYDPVKNQGEPYVYHSYGAACSQVEIDCLTGDHEVLRTDIVMDVGQSLNPSLDIGQIEGAFLQGYGLYTLEELLYAPNGALRTRGPSTYKIPTAGNVPRQFNVTLLPETFNPKAVYSSKAIGEPPVFLAASVFFAIREAVTGARASDAFYALDSPLTAERIRLACEDEFTSKAREVAAGEDGKETWFIRA